MEEPEYGGGIEYEDYEVETAPSGMATVLLIFTSIFLLLGIAFMGYELYSVYGFGNKNLSSSSQYGSE